MNTKREHLKFGLYGCLLARHSWENLKDLSLIVIIRDKWNNKFKSEKKKCKRGAFYTFNNDSLRVNCKLLLILTGLVSVLKLIVFAV